MPTAASSPTSPHSPQSTTGLRVRVALRVPEYAAGAMTKDTAKFILVETRRRAGLRFGEERALQRTLAAFGIDEAEYRRLHERHFFYRDAATEEITVPARQLRGALREAVQLLHVGAERERRLQVVQSLLIEPEDLRTGRTEASGVFGRPVFLRSSGRQGEVKGRWDFTENPILADLRLSATLSLPPGSLLSADDLRALLVAAGRFAGLGACRKVGKGRFTVEQCEREEGA